MNPELLSHHHGQDVIHDANGGYWERSYLTELLTLSTSGTTTDSAANLLPANSLIECVTALVTTDITTATDWSVGDGASPDRFSSPVSTMVAGTSAVGFNQHLTTGFSPQAGQIQSSASTVRITCTGTPGAGAIRITVYFSKFVASTS